MREDAARDRMRVFGFHERVISESIKELLEVYGEDQWFLIEDDSYGPLLAICLEKQAEKDKQLAEVQAYQLPENQDEEMAEDQNQEIAEEEQPNQLAEEEQEEEKHDPSFVIQEQEQDMQIEYGRDQADKLSINSDAVMDPSPAALHLGEALADYAQGSVGGSKSFYSYP
ncbi:hypothetical protein ARALYDRAFT_903269 [Arabidopsis lyrata subsp. lyrata]|uniref:WIYLD domain-containing protein n=1 Tax=Arabidopsis lyrata subsp. lyrata TaxID=81972 RepID=D7LEE7_ARALL|nr:hypothetical protein ARALYDRAFT_903269 [Arabidopsis lyrata subsp. lyrata]